MWGEQHVRDCPVRASSEKQWQRQGLLGLGTAEALDTVQSWIQEDAVERLAAEWQRQSWKKGVRVDPQLRCNVCISTGKRVEWTIMA